LGQFIKLLATYAPTTKNEALYDEKVLKKVKQLGLEEINIDNGFLDEIYTSFGKNMRSIVISGSAGDGKTYLLRKLYKKLDGNSNLWLSEYIPKINYKNKELIFIKDFTEINIKDKKDILMGVFNSINEHESDKLYIIAANDGILTDTLRDFIEKECCFNEFKTLLNLIEEHINHHGINDKLILFDLSQTSSARNFELLLDVILKNFDKHESNCLSLTNKDIFCPIHSNIALLKEENIKNQLIYIIRICDLNYKHITLRKLYMLISNMILGYKHDDKKRIFRSCELSIEKFKGNNRTKLNASFYNNLFGENLPKSKYMESPFKELNELRIGYEGGNNIDNFLLYGDLYSNEVYEKKLINSFIDFDIFFKMKEAYINEGSKENLDKLSDYMKFLRRHLFFTFNEVIPWGDNKIYLKELMAYEYAEEFYKEVITKLKSDQKINKTIIKKLVLGLNRVFLGELLSFSGNDTLYIASSLTNSSSKISSEIISRIGFGQKNLNQDVKLKIIKGFDEEYSRIILEIEYSNEIISSLELDLHMYEFLQRIADGILPTSFSVEYYERVLGFKSEIINSILKTNILDSFKLFELNDKNGTVQINEIEVIDGENFVQES